jgi:hypothetical protein
VQEVEILLGHQAMENLDFEALEMAVRQQVLRLAGQAVAQRLNADLSDEVGSRIRCGCGQQARFAGRRSKQVQSVLGSLHLQRAYYHCASCGQGFCPRDQQLGIANTSLSPALTRMIGTVGAMVSFQEGSELLRDLAGLAVDAKQVERTAEALGKEIVQDERGHSEPGGVLPLPQTLYLGMDGTGIPLRAEELVGRTGKQADGSAKTGEVKLCTIWSAESYDQEGLPVRDEGSVTYSAALESASAPDTAAERSPFAQRVLREATRRRFCQAPRAVVLGDGAPWIWNIAGEQFPEALQIVDRFHAKEHLSNLAKALYGPAHPRAALWAERRKEELDSGNFRALLTAISRQVFRSDDARRCLHYFQTNRERMRYPSSVRKACVLLPALSRLDARWPSVPGSNARACTGPSTAPTPSSPFAVANSVDASRTSGNEEPNRMRHDPSLSCRAPFRNLIRALRARACPMSGLATACFTTL